MSERTDHTDSHPSVSADVGFPGLQPTDEFRGPVESLEGHEDTDHFALVYEDQTEQFATVVPFVGQGIERGERCMYIVDDGSRDDVVAALRDGDVDVDAALDSGQLTFHSPDETFLEGGEVDVENTCDLLETALEDAIDEYEGFRVTAEETWLVDDEPAQEAFMSCEAHVNDLLKGEPGMALCQYDRTNVPPAVIEEVIETHPYLIYDGTACPNDYYTPPAEYFGPRQPERENERKLDTLVERTGTRASLEARERYERQLYEITSDPDCSFEEKLDALFDVGCELFDLDIGGLAKVDPDTNRFEVETVSGEHDHLVPGAEADLSETYCRVATDQDSDTTVADPVEVTDPVESGFDGLQAYEEFGVRAYLGSHLEVEGGPDRTFWFVSESPRDGGFSEAERTFHRLMGQWVQYELERRERERQLRERTDHLNALVETTPECIKTVDADGTLIQMNPAGLEMIEAPEESAAVGENVYDLIAPEDRERFREFNERICSSERGTLEFDIVGLDGTRRHMETHAAPLQRPDGTTLQVALTRDVTDVVERERDLERALDLLERTERIADVGGWEIDPETTEVFWTENLFDILEIPGDEEPPLDEALEVYHEDDRAIVADAIEESLEDGSPFDVEVRFRVPSGDVRWLRVQGVPETDDDGDVVSLRGAAQDVTVRKERERRLEDVVDRLEESNERLEQFAYAASHDLQEPLRMVSSYVQLLERRYADDLDDDAQEFIEFAVDGADRMRAMIDGLLQYSRVDEGDDPFEPVELDAVLADVERDLEVKIDETDAQITADPLPTVNGDAGQLNQVLLNLLDNAIRYSGDAPPRAHVSAERADDGEKWVLSVSDEGVGIDPRDEDRIFDVFQSLQGHDDAGCGIGLALCERIVERHDGDIWVDSEPGNGATFSLTLPAAAE